MWLGVVEGVWLRGLCQAVGTVDFEALGRMSYKLKVIDCVGRYTCQNKCVVMMVKLDKQELNIGLSQSTMRYYKNTTTTLPLK